MRGAFLLGRIVFRESLASRLFLGVILFLGLFFALALYFGSLSPGVPARFLTDAGMMGVSLIDLTVTLLFGLYFLYQAAERNALYPLLNHMTRGAYLWGRFLGSLGVMAVFSLLAGAGVCLLIRLFTGVWAPELLWSVYFGILEYGLLLAVGLFFYGLGVGFTLNALLVLGVYVLGHSLREAAGMFGSPTVLGGRLHHWLLEGAVLVFPNFDQFDFRGAILYGDPLLPLSVILVTAYAAAYVAALLLAGTYFLEKKDL